MRLVCCDGQISFRSLMSGALSMEAGDGSHVEFEFGAVVGGGMSDVRRSAACGIVGTELVLGVGW